MKKLLLSVTLLALCCGCDDKSRFDGVIWDFANYDVSVIVLGSQHRDNLFDPATEGNILDTVNDITVGYDGKTYRPNEPTTRLNPAHWQGLRIGKYYGYWGDSGTPALLFGEFQTDTDGYRGETLTIDWGDGTKDEVKFDLYITWAWNSKTKRNDPTVHKQIWINGELESSNSLVAVIVK